MKAFFFDLDGTLIDSRRDLSATVNHTRRDLGLEALSVEAVLKNVGCGAKYLLSKSIPEKPDEVERLWEIFRSHYAEHMLESCELYPTVHETLFELKRRGYLLGVNTSKPAFATRAILEHFGLKELFGEGVVAGGDLAEMKPSAAPLLECARRLGHTLTPEDWMVGDSWTDLECAANAGVKGAFCAFGFGDARKAKIDLSLDQMKDLLEIAAPNA